MDPSDNPARRPGRPVVPRLARVLSGALCVALATSTWPGAATVAAASIVVTTLGDSTGRDGLCSLREAITNTNLNAAPFPDCAPGAGADTITFGVTGSVQLVGDLPTITDSSGLTVDGGARSVTIRGGQGIRSFGIVASGAQLILKGLVIEGANVLADGAALHVKSGGTAAIEDSTIRNNRIALLSCGPTIDCTDPRDGGAIANEGNLTVSRSSVTGNISTRLGGAIFNAGEARIVDSTLSGNLAAQAGGAISSSGRADVLRSTLTANRAAVGGAVEVYLHDVDHNYLDPSVRGGEVRLINSTLTQNAQDDETYRAMFPHAIAPSGGGVAIFIEPGAPLS